MRSLFTPHYRTRNYRPIISAYYDRPDMVATTMPNEPLHRHNLCEIMYVTSGNTKIEVEESVVPLRKRQLIFLDSNVPHRNILASEPNGMINIEFNLEISSPQAQSLRALAEANVPFQRMLALPARFRVLDDLDGMIFSLMKQMISLADSEHDKAVHLCSQLVCMLLLLLARRWQADDTRIPLTASNRHVNNVLRRIHERFDEPLSVAELAREEGLHPAYLTSLFKRIVDQTPSQYIRSLRLKQARHLLLSTDYSILRIATSVGYSGQQHFVRAFREEYGSAPSAYRKNMR